MSCNISTILWWIYSLLCRLLMCRIERSYKSIQYDSLYCYTLIYYFLRLLAVYPYTPKTYVSRCVLYCCTSIYYVMRCILYLYTPTYYVARCVTYRSTRSILHTELYIVSSERGSCVNGLCWISGTQSSVCFNLSACHPVSGKLSPLISHLGCACQLGFPVRTALFDLNTDNCEPFWQVLGTRSGPS